MTELWGWPELCLCRGTYSFPGEVLSTILASKKKNDETLDDNLAIKPKTFSVIHRTNSNSGKTVFCQNTVKRLKGTIFINNSKNMYQCSGICNVFSYVGEAIVKMTTQANFVSGEELRSKVR